MERVLMINGSNLLHHIRNFRWIFLGYIPAKNHRIPHKAITWVVSDSWDTLYILTEPGSFLIHFFKTIWSFFCTMWYPFFPTKLLLGLKSHYKALKYFFPSFYIKGDESINHTENKVKLPHWWPVHLSTFRYLTSL